MRRAFEIGGLVTGVVLIVFGVVAITMGLSGGRTVNNSLKQEQIVGSADFTPTAIKAVAAKAGNANKNLPFPTCSLAGVAVTNGATARCFAQYMQIDTLDATGGFYFSQMGIYTAKTGAPKAQLLPGGGTDNAAYALIDPTTKQPVQNGARSIWVEETGLTTALNTAYMASRLALFGIVVGVALLLAGLGFAILTIGGALRNPEGSLRFGEAKPKVVAPSPIPTV
jgi:hypothetical protein